MEDNNFNTYLFNQDFFMKIYQQLVKFYLIQNIKLLLNIQQDFLAASSSQSTAPKESTQTQIYVKIGFILLIFLETILFGIIPQKWKRCRKNEHILSIANCFSGGVFLAIAFVHIIPESAKIYYLYKYDGYSLENQSQTLKSINEFPQLQQDFTDGQNQKVAYSPYQNMLNQFQIVSSQRILENKVLKAEDINLIVQEFIELSYSSFPLPFVLVLAGYAFILLLDKVLISGNHSHDGNHSKDQTDQDNLSGDLKNSNPFQSIKTSPMITQISIKPGKNYTIQELVDPFKDFQERDEYESQQTPMSSLRKGSDKSDILKVNNRKDSQQKEDKLRKNFISLISRNDKFASQVSAIISQTPSNRQNKNKLLFKTYNKHSLEKMSDNLIRQKSQDSMFRRGSEQHNLSLDFESFKKSNDLRTISESSQEELKQGLKLLNPNQQLNNKSETDSSTSSTKQRCDCSYLKSLVLLIALSTHSIFEGIALGLTPELSGLINLMIGLLFHKGPAAMSLGISLSKRFKEDHERRKAIIFLVLFALATPIGIGLGMLLQSANNLVEVLFSSFAGGTFIYIAASEVIVEEFSIMGQNKWLKMLIFTLGAASITCMWLLES